MIDTLKLAKRLQRAGMSAHQSELFAEALREARTDYVTKSDLNAAIAELKIGNR